MEARTRRLLILCCVVVMLVGGWFKRPRYEVYNRCEVCGRPYVSKNITTPGWKHQGLCQRCIDLARQGPHAIQNPDKEDFRMVRRGLDQR